MRKRLPRILLAALLIVGVLPLPVRAPRVRHTVTLTVGASADDAMETNDSSISLTGGSLSVGRNNGSTVRDIGLRFANCPVPRGAVIQEAHLVLTAYNGSSNRVSTVFRGLETLNLSAFSSANRPSQIAKTSANVPWSPGSWSSGNTYSSPNVSAVVQEIVGQLGWQAGSAIGLSWEDNGSSSGNQRAVYSRDNSSSRSAKLSITYTYDPTPGPDVTPPTVGITSPVAGASVTGRVSFSAAVDDDRGVADVGFYADGSLIASDAAPPFGCLWDTASVPEGGHTLSVRAVDTSGNVTVATTACSVDRTPPAISGVSVASAGTSTVSVSWSTDEPATSRLEYGTTTAYGSTTATDASAVTSHNVTVSGLMPDRVYHLRAASADSAGNSASSSDVSTRTLLGPITASVTVTVAVAADDVTEANDQTLTTTGSSLAVGRPGESTVQDIGFRFAAVPIPAGATIQEAHLVVTAYSSGISDSVSTRFYGLETPSVSRFTSTYRPSQIAKTSAHADWSPGSWSSSATYDSPDLTALVREIVAQPGWQQGNALGIAWQDNGSSGGHRRTIYARDYSAARAAKLSVTYTYVPADVTPPVVHITSPGAGAALSGVVTVAADASDERGVEAIGFYADGTLIATDTAAPYAASFDTASWAPGAHTLTARAVDTSGNVAVDTIGCVIPDLTTPVVSAFQASAVGPDSVTLTWSTNEPATSRIDYGATSAYGASTATDTALVTSHSVTVPGLSPNTAYHFRAASADSIGNVGISSDLATTTLPTPTTFAVTVDLASPYDDVVEVNDASLRAVDGYLEVGRSDGTNVTDTGLRFPDVPVPKGAVIQEAHISFLSFTYGLDGNLSSVFRGMKTPALAAFSATSRPSQIPQTTGSVSWAPPVWTANTVYASPDLKGLVQEIIDQPGWAQGAPIGFVWQDTGTPAWQSRLVYSHDVWTGPASGPRLTITYAADPTPDTTPPTVRLTSPSPGATVGGLVTLSADASDDRKVTGVGFYADGTIVATDTTAPFGIGWDTTSASAGPHTIEARAVDAAGNAASDSLGCTVERDTTPPVISNVAVLPGTRSATVSWTTNEPATSMVSYGKTSLMGTNVGDPALSTAHSVVLTGLDPATIYYFAVGSGDAANNVASSMMSTFATVDTPKVSGPPVASFSFDDCLESGYTYAYPILKSHGFPGCEYVVTDIVGQPSDLTLAELKEMQASGWEIGSHTADHNVGAGSTPAAYEADVKRAYDWLNANGFAGGGFASPGGAWSHDIIRVVRKYHPYLRIADNQNTAHPYDPYKVSTHFLTGSTTIAEVRGWLDHAQANHEWVLFSMHGVGPTGFDTRPQLIEDICNELQARRIPVYTPGEIMAADRPSDTTIDCWVDSTQQPVMATAESPSVLDPARWNEYWEEFFGYPVIEAMSGASLSTVRFYRSVPNGTYEVYANVYSSGQRQFRYYYSFNDPANPQAMHLDADVFEGDREYHLGTVTVTDGTFSLYTNRIDSLSGPGTDWYGAWGWVKLVR